MLERPVLPEMPRLAELYDGDLAVVRDWVGVICDPSNRAGDTEANYYGARRYVLRPIPGLPVQDPRFTEIQITPVEWPKVTVRPTELFSVTAELAKETRIIGKCVQKLAPGEEMRRSELTYHFILDEDVFRAFERVMARLDVSRTRRDDRLRRRILFYRLLGCTYEQALGRWPNVLPRA